MFILKRKVIVAGAAIAVLMSAGCITAFAATSGPALSPAGYVDISKIDVQEGTYTVGDGTNIQLSDGQTASTVSAPLTPASGSIDTANVQEGTFTMAGSVSLHTIDGVATTAGK